METLIKRVLSGVLELEGLDVFQLMNSPAYTELFDSTYWDLNVLCDMFEEMDWMLEYHAIMDCLNFAEEDNTDWLAIASRLRSIL